MRVFALALALALLLGLAASTSAPTAAQERPLVIALGAEPRSLVSMRIVDWTTLVQQENIYDRLYYWDGNPPKIVPSLAAELPKTPDDLTWIVKLRPNVKFTNGDPLTAEALKFQLEWILDPKN